MLKKDIVINHFASDFGLIHYGMIDYLTSKYQRKCLFSTMKCLKSHILSDSI